MHSNAANRAKIGVAVFRSLFIIRAGRLTICMCAQRREAANSDQAPLAFSSDRDKRLVASMTNLWMDPAVDAASERPPVVPVLYPVWLLSKDAFHFYAAG